MADQIIKSEQWRVINLIGILEKKKIIKDKYQRKRKWDINLKKEKVPNERDFIIFLFANKNSVHAITFGVEIINGIEIYYNIDGNNRINAIYHFFKKPFEIFEEYLDNLNKIIDECNYKNKNELKDIFKNLSYNDIIDIRKLKVYFKSINKEETWIEMDKKLCEDLDEEIENIQNKLHKNGDFGGNVLINVNLCKGYTKDELNEMYFNVNKYNSNLTETELLSSSLYNVTDFTISDSDMKTKLNESIKEYYKNKSEGEILQCFEYTDKNSMNAYDFIMGLHTLHSNKYGSFINKPDVDGLSLYFKLWIALYDNYNKDTFSKINVNEFIQHIEYSCEILNKTYNLIFTDKINDKLFNKGTKKKMYTLKKNNIFIIFSYIISCKNINENDNEVIRKLEIILLYHFFTSDIKNKERREYYKIYDKISYTAGGSYIRNLAKNILKTPDILLENKSEEYFIGLLKDLFNESNNPHERKLNGKVQREKRRQLKFFEKTCMFYYYKSHMPTDLLNNKFSIEHIIPNSSDWNEDLDKDRTGNLFPILDKLNCARGNKHINCYSKTKEGENFRVFVKDIITSDEKYNEIIEYDNNKPNIKNNQLYNEMCEKNENIYIKCIIDKLFNCE
tara:strand:- start:3809 stop:5665 length:1857 start_codon:yes stop_codon:yes gene_type:complete